MTPRVVAENRTKTMFLVEFPPTRMTITTKTHRHTHRKAASRETESYEVSLPYLVIGATTWYQGINSSITVSCRGAPMTASDTTLSMLPFPHLYGSGQICYQPRPFPEIARPNTINEDYVVRGASHYLNEYLTTPHSYLYVVSRMLNPQLHEIFGVQDILRNSGYGKPVTTIGDPDGLAASTSQLFGAIIGYFASHSLDEVCALPYVSRQPTTNMRYVGGN